jgi:lysophospholipase L1-like esterase
MHSDTANPVNSLDSDPEQQKLSTMVVQANHQQQIGAKASGCVDSSLVALMPISNAVSIGLVGWACVDNSGGAPDIVTVAGALAALYMLWTLLDYWFGHSETYMGMFTMGCVVLGKILATAVDRALGNWVATVGVATVVVSFAIACFVLPHTKVYGRKSSKKPAERSGKSLLWAKVLKMYNFVSLLTWSLILGLLIDNNYAEEQQAPYAHASVSGSISGNVSGSISGNVSGSISSNVSGSISGNVSGSISGNVSSLCILPLGDSITQAATSSASYRYPLWKLLVDAGIKVQYTGSMTQHFGGAPRRDLHPSYKGLVFPAHHEGHYGWTVSQILKGGTLGCTQQLPNNNVCPDAVHWVDTARYPTTGSGGVTSWMTSYGTLCDPNVVLLHLGTNDICHNITGITDNVMKNLKLLISTIGAVLRLPPGRRLTVLLAVPIPTCCVQTSIILGPAIKANVQTLGNSNVTVRLVDMSSGWRRGHSTYLNAPNDHIYTSRSWTVDGCHPDVAGEEFMATQWYKALSVNE